MNDIILVQDVYDALRVKAGLEGDEARDTQLSSYIEVMSGYGFGKLDRVQIEEAGAHGEGEPTHNLSVTYSTASDLWRGIKRNINKGGIFLQVTPFATMDTMVMIQVILEEPALTFSGKAKVIFVNPQERSGRPMGMGIKFLWDEENAALFKRFLKADIDPTELDGLNQVSLSTDGEESAAIAAPA